MSFSPLDGLPLPLQYQVLDYLDSTGPSSISKDILSMECVNKQWKKTTLDYLFLTKKNLFLPENFETSPPKILSKKWYKPVVFLFYQKIVDDIGLKALNFTKRHPSRRVVVPLAIGFGLATTLSMSIVVVAHLVENSVRLIFFNLTSHPENLEVNKDFIREICFSVLHLPSTFVGAMVDIGIVIYDMILAPDSDFNYAKENFFSFQEQFLITLGFPYLGMVDFERKYPPNPEEGKRRVNLALDQCFQDLAHSAFHFSDYDKPLVFHDMHMAKCYIAYRESPEEKFKDFTFRDLLYQRFQNKEEIALGIVRIELDSVPAEKRYYRDLSSEELTELKEIMEYKRSQYLNKLYPTTL